MDTSTIRQDPVLAEIVRRLIEAYQPERIYLFGSLARGEGGPDSDYDLMVVVPDDAPAQRHRSRLAYQVLRGTGRRPGMLPQLLRQPGPCTRLTSGDHRLRRPARTHRVTTPHDPARVAEARAWVVRAARDLRAAEHEFHAVPPLLDDIVFHCQQAAEKAPKGFLTWHERPFRRTHSLEELGEQCLTVVPALRPIIDRAVPPTEYAWKFRNPDEMEEPSRTEAEDALAIAREVYLAIISRLPADVQ